jgi:hypothetical protein
LELQIPVFISGYYVLWIHRVTISSACLRSLVAVLFPFGSSHDILCHSYGNHIPIKYWFYMWWPIIKNYKEINNVITVAVMKSLSCFHEFVDNVGCEI